MSQNADSDRPALALGQVLAHRYRIEQQLGAGGLGTAFAATDLLRTRRVALKLLRNATPERLEIFRREFSTLSGLVHPNLARVHDFASAPIAPARRAHFYTSDLVDGVSLDAFARGKPWAVLREVLVQALSALDFLHRAGLRHGDFKPDNVLVTVEGEPRLIDLSCSAPFSENAMRSGTAGYVAPEVGNGRRIDARADLFSVGATLRAVLPLLSKPPPAEVCRIADKLSSSDPDQRPLDVAGVLAELGIARPERLTISPEPARLLERDAELESFGQLLQALLAGQAGPRAVCIRGAAGTGKTRLLNEMKWRAQLECAVVEADVYEARPVRALLERSLGERIGDELSALLAARRRLAERSPPLLLVIDDAHLLSEPRQADLLALLRTTEPSDRLGLLIAAETLPGLPQSCLTLELEPLSRGAIGDWSRGLLPESRLSALVQVTGGRPAAVLAVLSELASGRISEGELPRLTLGQELGSEREQQLLRCSDDELDALALLAVGARPLLDDELHALGLSSTMLARLAEQGLIQHASRALTLAHGIAQPALLAALGQARALSAHARLADHALAAHARASDPLTVSEHAASAVRHLVSGNRAEEARRLFLDKRRLSAASPTAWLGVAELMVSAASDPQTTLAIAELLDSCGQPERALKLLEQAPAWAKDWQAEREFRLGAAWLAKGDAPRASEHLERARACKPEPALGAQIADAAARAAIARGEYAAALAIAREALSDELDRASQAALLNDLGAATSYLGEIGSARAYFEQAAELGAEGVEPRAVFRAHTHRAFHEYRSGNVAVAIEYYQRALEIAEQHGLDDRIANAAVSLAAAHHQTGAWADALSSYERGLSSAVALGQTASEVLLRFNIAKLHADIGLFDRAEVGAERARELAHAASLGLLEAAASAVLGEIELGRQRYAPAIEQLTQARRAFEREGALREEVEVTLQLAEAELGRHQLERASAELDRAAERLERLDAEDVRVRYEICRGRWLRQSGRIADSQRVLEAAAGRAAELDQEMLEADVELALAELWRESGAPTLADQCRTRARQRWERVSAALPEKLREAFWRHPAREQPVLGVPSTHAAPGMVERLRRLVEINKKLSSSLDPNEVLERTMDAAIELTGAERGFLIQRKAGGRKKDELVVSIARNLDREQIGKRHLKFSRSIAERTIASGEPIVTLDAGSDERFTRNESVHAMRLKSVVCVPIRTPKGVIGALYVDNRFRRDTFQADDLELLIAFGDQAAIALENARLHYELARQSAELERERRRVEELSRAQAAEIGRLTTRVREQQEVLQHRYDYAEIVGRSPKMQRVFATLDRVTETSVSILIDGESGTGKELVARAIHFNSSRRERPYVAINCGAVPAALLESELFGHVRGAFTGADREREGLLVAVDGGTMFLDEIGDMPLDMQVKLLRVLQEREVRPIGSSKTTRVDFRLVCATNRRLRDEVAAGRFREDLFYRIGVVELTLPPLRERIEDLPELVRHFLARLAKEHDRKPPRLTPGALQRLAAHTWPGNVRELENVLTRTLVLSRGDRIDAAEIVLPDAALPSMRATSSRDEFLAAEAAQIRAALRDNRWNVSAACRALGLARSSFYRKVRRYGIDLAGNDNDGA